MSFLAGRWLWMLVAVAGVAGGYGLVRLRRRADAVRFTNVSLLEGVAPRHAGWRRHLPAAAMLVALTSLVVALARPARAELVPRESATIMVAIDVSLSMQATDVSPTRLAAAESAASSFVDLIPSRLNIGVVSFSGVADVLVPPTTDHSLVKRALSQLVLGPRTAIGDAVFASLGAIAAVPRAPGQAPPPARIVLLSDGTTTVGQSNDAASAAAKAAGVPISTIAFGTSTGTVDVNGQSIDVPVDKAALAAIATTTGGQAFEASSASALRAVYADIGHAVGFRTERREVGTWFIGIALAAAFAAAGGSLLWSSRLP